MSSEKPSEPVLPSNRSFGGLFVVVFAALATWTWARGGSWYVAWAALAALTLVVTLAAPQRLTPLNRLWMRFAALLHRVVSPVVLGVMFFALVTPFGVIRRLAGRDPMARRFEPGASTYWIERRPPGPDPKTMTQQF